MIIDRTEHPSRLHVEALTRSWWIVWPVFLLLSVRLVADRTCGDPYDLLPGVTSNPRWAWPLALIYVAGHLWCLFAYLLTTQATGTLAPGVPVIKAVWGRHAVKVFLMVAVLALEYSPMPVWRLVGAYLRCHQ